MSGRFFIDTSVLLYADDAASGVKQPIAQGIIVEGITSRRGVLSTQVLQEYFVVGTKKLGLERKTARRKVQLLATMDVVCISQEDVVAAIDLHGDHIMSFWDALIVRCAQRAGCARLITEDLNDGQAFGDVRVHNPFPSPTPTTA